MDPKDQTIAFYRKQAEVMREALRLISQDWVQSDTAKGIAGDVLKNIGPEHPQ